MCSVSEEQRFYSQICPDCAVLERLWGHGSLEVDSDVMEIHVGASRDVCVLLRTKKWEVCQRKRALIGQNVLPKVSMQFIVNEQSPFENRKQEKLTAHSHRSVCEELISARTHPSFGPAP